MPSRRAAAIILAAAVCTGATAGVSAAIANVEVPGLLVAAPSRTQERPQASSTPTPVVPTPQSAPLSEPPTASPEPTRQAEQPKEPEQPVQPEPKQPEKTTEPEAKPVAPTEFIEVDFSAPGMGPDGEGGSTSRVEVPKGWSIDGRGVQWRDFHDPTGNLNLRVRGDFLGDSDEDAATKAKAERQKSQDYTELGWKEITFELEGRAEKGIEYRFSWTGSKGTRYGVERYFLDGNAMAGGYAWKGQLDLVEPAVERASQTYVGGGG